MRALAQRLTINDLYKLDVCLRSVAEHKRTAKRVPFLKSSVGHIFYENGRRIANVTTIFLEFSLEAAILKESIRRNYKSAVNMSRIPVILRRLAI